MLTCMTFSSIALHLLTMSAAQVQLQQGTTGDTQYRCAYMTATSKTGGEYVSCDMSGRGQEGYLVPAPQYPGLQRGYEGGLGRWSTHQLRPAAQQEREGGPAAHTACCTSHAVINDSAGRCSQVLADAAAALVGSLHVLCSCYCLLQSGHNVWSTVLGNVGCRPLQQHRVM